MIVVEVVVIVVVIFCLWKSLFRSKTRFFLFKYNTGTATDRLIRPAYRDMYSNLKSSIDKLQYAQVEHLTGFSWSLLANSELLFDASSHFYRWVCPSVRLTVHMSVHLYVHMSVHLYVHMSVPPSVSNSDFLPEIAQND